MGSATRTSCAACTASRRRPSVGKGAKRATLLGSGSIMQQALRAQAAAGRGYGVAAEVWSAPSYQLLRNEALEVERWNRLHPGRASTHAVRDLGSQGCRCGRSYRGRERLGQGRARPGLALGAGRQLALPRAPTDSGAATPARRCAGSSASMRSTSRRRHWRSSPVPGRWSRRPRQRPWPTSASTPRPPTRSAFSHRRRCSA